MKILKKAVALILNTMLITIIALTANAETMIIGSEEDVAPKLDSTVDIYFAVGFDDNTALYDPNTLGIYVDGVVGVIKPYKYVASDNRAYYKFSGRFGITYKVIGTDNENADIDTNLNTEITSYYVMGEDYFYDDGTQDFPMLKDIDENGEEYEYPDYTNATVKEYCRIYGTDSPETSYNPNMIGVKLSAKNYGYYLFVVDKQNNKVTENVKIKDSKGNITVVSVPTSGYKVDNSLVSFTAWAENGTNSNAVSVPYMVDTLRKELFVKSANFDYVASNLSETAGSGVELNATISSINKLDLIRPAHNFLGISLFENTPVDGDYPLDTLLFGTGELSDGKVIGSIAIPDGQYYAVLESDNTSGITAAYDDGATIKTVNVKDGKIQEYITVNITASATLTVWREINNAKTAFSAYIGGANLPSATFTSLKEPIVYVAVMGSAIIAKDTTQPPYTTKNADGVDVANPAVNLVIEGQDNQIIFGDNQRVLVDGKVYVEGGVPKTGDKTLQLIVVLGFALCVIIALVVFYAISNKPNKKSTDNASKND
jgi:hypothetical protein